MELYEIKERYIELYRQNIKRDGSEAMLNYLLSSDSDFFFAPASMRYHSNYAGGLAEHSINVYEQLIRIMSRDDVYRWVSENHDPKFSLEETLAVTALLHDVCKINFYKPSKRNVKGEDGRWHEEDYYTIDDRLPYGHGEKSVYIISGFMRLSREEAFAIRYHMGFSSNCEDRDVSAAFKMFPLAYAVSCADTEATFYIEQDLRRKISK